MQLENYKMIPRPRPASARPLHVFDSTISPSRASSNDASNIAELLVWHSSDGGGAPFEDPLELDLAPTATPKKAGPRAKVYRPNLWHATDRGVPLL